MNTNDKIFLGGAILDFYVSKSKYNKYKTERGKMNFVYRELNKILNSLTNEVVHTTNKKPQINLHPDITLRDVSITSNNFWGTELLTVNDLDYSCNNPVPKVSEDKNVIPIRLFQIDVVGLINNSVLPQHLFFRLIKKNFVLRISNYKLV